VGRACVAVSLFQANEAACHLICQPGFNLPPPCRWFDLDQNSSGRLATVLSSDATYVRGAVADGLGVLLQVRAGK